MHTCLTIKRSPSLSKLRSNPARASTVTPPAQDFQRRAQFYVDFIESENSNGFHADQEAARMLGESINFSRKGEIALRGTTQEPDQRNKATTKAIARPIAGIKRCARI